MKKLDPLTLYVDLLGNEVSTPVIQAGSGEPHVVMTALQHGWEIIGLDTALQVMESCVPKGTITLISVLSPMAYIGGGRFSPQNQASLADDAQNMNRLHPGSSEGTNAERVAEKVNEYIEVLSPDYVIDLHSYAAQSVPHVILDPSEPKMQEKLQTWARRSGNIWYCEYNDETLSAQALDRALSATWVNKGVPAVTIELGPIQMFSVAQSKKAAEALSSLLIACGAIEGNLVNRIPDLLRNDTWQRVEIIYNGDVAGYVRTKVEILESVQQGQVIGEVVLPNGDIAGSIIAPSDGVHFIWGNEHRASPGLVVGVQLARY